MEIFKKDVNLIHSTCFFKQYHAPFVSEISFHQRKFVIFDYFIKKNQFTVKIDYDKEQLGHLIDHFVHEMILGIRTIRFCEIVAIGMILFLSLNKKFLNTLVIVIF